MSACGFRDPHPAGNASGRSSGSPRPARLPASRQWLSDRTFKGITAAGPLRPYTGFPVMARGPPEGHLELFESSQRSGEAQGPNAPKCSLTVRRPVPAGRTVCPGIRRRYSMNTGGCPALRGPVARVPGAVRFRSPCAAPPRFRPAGRPPGAPGRA